MRKINKFPKTRMEFYRCHVKMWGWICDYINKNKMIPIHCIDLKNLALKKCFNSQWYKKINSGCFPCHWLNLLNEKNNNCRKYCLLKTNNIKRDSDCCLNDNYCLFKYALQKNNKAMAFEYAAKIRDKKLNPNYNPKDKK